MRFLPVVLLIAVLIQASQVKGPTTPVAPAIPGCAPLGKPYLRTTLYFGLAKQTGTISETHWRTFLSTEVSPRFPQGLTVWEANGQWRRADGRIGRERAKVLLLVHEDSPETRESLTSLVSTYKRSFEQESVLWETAPVCAAF